MSEDKPYDPNEVPSKEAEAHLREILAHGHGADKETLERAEAAEKEADTPQLKMRPEVNFSNMSPESLDIAAAIDGLDLPEIKIDEAMREKYLKAVLLDEPFEHTIPLFEGKLQLSFRGRTLAEQEAVARLLRMMEVTEEVPADNPLAGMTFIQYFVLMFSLTRANETGYTPPTKELEESDFRGIVITQAMRENKALILEDPLYKKALAWIKQLRSFHQTRLHAMVTGARIFEAICAKLGTEATAPNFSSPQDAQP